MAGHIKKDYKAGDPKLAKYLEFFREQEKYFEGFTVKNISRTDNSDADEIAKAPAQNLSLPQDVFFQVLTHASIKVKQEVPRKVHVIQSEDWRAPIMAYLQGITKSSTISCTSKEFVAHIQGQKPWHGKHSDKDFIGPQHKVTVKK